MPTVLGQPTAAPVALQRHSEVVGPDRQSQFVDQVLANLLCGGLVSKRFDGSQGCLTERDFRLSLRTATASRRPPASTPRRSRLGFLLRPPSAPAASGSRSRLGKAGQYPLSSFELCQLLGQLRSFRIHPSQPLSDALPLRSDVI